MHDSIFQREKHLARLHIVYEMLIYIIRRGYMLAHEWTADEVCVRGKERNLLH